MNQRPIDILLVEDNRGDILVTTEAFEESALRTSICVARDGQEAVDLLEDATRSYRPDLILLDLNLPRLDGHQVLARLKRHKELKRIPVMILTSSREPGDVLRAYDEHANSYLTKPVGIDDMQSMVESVQTFWFRHNVPPPRVAPPPHHAG